MMVRRIEEQTNTLDVTKMKEHLSAELDDFPGTKKNTIQYNIETGYNYI